MENFPSVYLVSPLVDVALEDRDEAGEDCVHREDDVIELHRVHAVGVLLEVLGLDDGTEIQTSKKDIQMGSSTSKSSSNNRSSSTNNSSKSSRSSNNNRSSSSISSYIRCISSDRSISSISSNNRSNSSSNNRSSGSNNNRNSNKK